MKSLTILSVFIVAASSLLGAQSLNHPWHVVDRGGGRSSSAILTLQASIGQPAIQRMASASNILEGGYIPGLRQLSGAASTLSIQTASSWNLVSVPLIVSDYRKAALYPGASSAAFTYQGTYKVRDTLRNGIGYWVKYRSPQTESFSGTVFATETLDVNDKWNMIGCTSYPVRASNIQPVPPTTIASNYYGYATGSGYYKADTLFPGQGYWVKVNNSGKIVLSASSMLPSANTMMETFTVPVMNIPSRNDHNFNSITFKDAIGREQTIYFSSSAAELDLEKFQLPPLPPPGIFDVRFATNRQLETAEKDKNKDVGIQISSAEYPVTLRWNVQDHITRSTLRVDKKEIQIKGDGSITISNPESQIKLTLSPASGREIPEEFALAQNYPNPFNPTTVIHYDLPKDVHVNLRVYNSLGQLVRTVVDEMQQAGYRSVEVNATDLASGMYFYRLTAGNFVEVKKMLLVR